MSNIQHEKDTVQREITKLENKLREIEVKEKEARAEIQEGERDLQQELSEKTHVSQELQRERIKLTNLERREVEEIKEKHKQDEKRAA